MPVTSEKTNKNLDDKVREELSLGNFNPNEDSLLKLYKDLA